MEIGILEIPVDGRWTLDDLDAFAEAIRLSYAYFYAVTPETAKDEDRIGFLMQRYFWSGTYTGDEFASKLYHAIPEAGMPYVRKFEYASPGTIEIEAAALALGALSMCVRSWLKTGSTAFQLYKDIDEYFTKRRLRRIPKNFDLDMLTPADIDRARELCFEFARDLGMNDKATENILTKAGNPISGLKLLAQMGHEAERLGRLELGGKLKLSKAKVKKLSSPTAEV